MEETVTISLENYDKLRKVEQSINKRLVLQQIDWFHSGKLSTYYMIQTEQQVIEEIKNKDSMQQRRIEILELENEKLKDEINSLKGKKNFKIW